MPTLAVVPLISRRGFVGLAKEATWGTFATPTIWLPTKTRDLTPDIAKISVDVALNTRSRDFLIVNGRRQAAGTIGGPAFGTSFGNLLMAVSGTDTVASPAVAPTGLTATASASGGTLATLTYGYRVTAVSGAGETTPAAEVTAAVTGPTGSVKLTWNEVFGALGYNVYGRTTGGELKMLASTSPTVGAGTGTQITVAGGVLTFTDTGAITPAGALPGSNTFGPLHVFTMANVLPSYSIEQNRGGTGTDEQFAGCIGNELSFAAKFDANDGVLDYVWNLLGAFPATPPSAAGTFVKPTDKPAVAAKASLAYGGASWAKVMEISAVIKNNAEAIKIANSSPDINNAFGTDVEVDGTARIVFDAYTSEYTDWYQNNAKSLSFNFPFESGECATIYLPQAILDKWKFRDSGRFVEASFAFKGQYDATTAGNFKLALACSQVAGF